MRLSSNSRAFHPSATREAFKDLLIFEERLKQNSERLQHQRRKYQSFLASLVSVIAYLVYSVAVDPSIYSLVHYAHVASLLVAATTLVLFFATGVYTDKIAYAYKFVPQANRALRPFNIYLNTRSPSTWSRLERLNPFRSTDPTPPSRSSSRPPPPPPPPNSSRATGVPIPPIPPARNPRGELIFSNRVNPTFREGYERYRGEWDRRRKENRDLEPTRANSSWFASPTTWFARATRRASSDPKGASSPPEPAATTKSSEGREKDVRRGGTIASPTSSQHNSRSNSSERPPIPTVRPGARRGGSARSAVASSNDDPTALAPLDSDDPSATSTPPPQFLSPEPSSPRAIRTPSPLDDQDDDETTTSTTTRTNHDRCKDQVSSSSSSPQQQHQPPPLPLLQPPPPPRQQPQQQKQHHPSRIRAESFSELLELEQSSLEENGTTPRGGQDDHLTGRRI